MRELSSNMRRLLDRMWEMGYGSIRGLHVRDGEPQFEPPFVAVRTIRLADASQKRSPARSSQRPTKPEHVAFQQELADVGCGVVDIIKVHDGVPVSLEFQESP